MQAKLFQGDILSFNHSTSERLLPKNAIGTNVPKSHVHAKRFLGRYSVI